MSRLVRSAPVLLFALVLGSCAVRPAAAGWADRVDGLRNNADVLVNQHRYREAETILRRIFTLPAPYSRPGARDLIRDVHFALGRVLLLQGRAAEALEEADTGLAVEGPEGGATVFVANLHALRAMACEELGRPLDAVTDYGRAMLIHKALFDEALMRRKRGEG